MKNKLLFLSFLLLLNHSLISMDTTESMPIARSKQHELAAMACLFGGFAGFFIWMTASALKNVYKKKASWSDDWDKQNSNRQAVAGGIFGTLICVPMSGFMGYLWMKNFRKWDIPLLVLTDQGFTYKKNDYAWAEVKDMIYQQTIVGNSVKYRLVIKMQKATKNLCIGMEKSNIKADKLIGLLNLYRERNAMIDANIHFNLAADQINELEHLREKVTNNYIVRWYDVLGISENATLKEIETAWKKFSIKLHPDKTGGRDTEELRIVNHAHDYIMKLKKATSVEEIEDLLTQYESYLVN